MQIQTIPVPNAPHDALGMPGGSLGAAAAQGHPSDVAGLQPLAPIDNVADLTPAWLSAALGGAARVAAVNCSRIGVGEGFASRLYRLRPEYVPGHTGPASLILKLQSDNPELLKVMNPDVAFREARFYRDLAGDVAQPVPQVPYSDYDVARCCYTIVMEDLPGIRFGFDATPAESEAAMRALARIHARFWRHPLLDEPWLQPVARTDIDLHWLIAHALAAADAAGFGDSHLSRALRVIQPLVPRLAVDPNAAPPVFAHSLCHGDFHRNNSVLQDDGRFVIFDWQMLEAGNPLRDVGYWMITSMTVEQRRTQQKRLLRSYHEALLAAGVRDYPARKLQQDFRNGMLENLVRVYCIPALVEADPELLVLLRDRVEAASQDMHTIAFAHLLKALLGVRDWWGRITA